MCRCLSLFWSHAGQLRLQPGPTEKRGNPWGMQGLFDCLMKTSPVTGRFKSIFISLASSHALNSSQVNSLAGSFHPNSNINESTTSCNCTRLQIQLACEISLRINKANVQCRPWWDHRCAGHTPLGCPADPTQLLRHGRGST